MSAPKEQTHQPGNWRRVAALAACVAAAGLLCAAATNSTSQREQTSAASALSTPTAARHTLPGEQHDVFVSGKEGYHTYRIPALAVTTSGTVLAFCEGRRNSGADSGDIDLLLKRSHDGGRTWSNFQVIHSEPGDVTIGNPVPVVDRERAEIWLAFCRNNRRVFVTKSSDDARSWSTPREITSSVRRPEWRGWYATGPGHGVQLAGGRLVIPANHGVARRAASPSKGKRTTSAHAIFSDDHGQTWTIGDSVGDGTNEATMAARRDGTLVINCRPNPGKHSRAVATSPDGGQTWSPVSLDEALVCPVCQGSLLAAKDETGRGIFLFSNPASLRRERLTLRLSEDEGRAWRFSRVLYEGETAYSDLCDLGNGTFGCLYERDHYRRLTFARVRLQWLREGEREQTTGEKR